MSKFASTATVAPPTGALRTLPGVSTRTYNGGVGFVKDARTELFSLGVANFVSEDTYYEAGAARDKRYVDLVREVTALDPAWIGQFLPWLRNEANMRTASVVGAVEAARAMVDAGVPGGRQLIARTLGRADEPAEALGYWLSKYGRKIPMPVKRGIADAAVKLYSQNAALKYDSREHNIRMFDVIELCHPDPKDETQAALFKYLGDRRHNRDNPRGLELLGKVASTRAALKAASQGEEIEVTSGMTWEQALSAGGNNAETWMKILPQMGYMAILRNLRNFEDAKLPNDVMIRIGSMIADPEQVAQSKQLPFRFLSAWKASGSMAFAQPLELGLEACLANIPEFPGKTLVMVDVSGSMAAKLSAKSTLSRKAAGGVFGAAVMKRSAPGSKLGVYASGVAAQERPRSLLRSAEEMDNLDGVNGHSTNTWPSTKAMWDEYGPFDRILIFTDEQHNWSHLSADTFPKSCPIYLWNLAGYKPAGLDVGSGRHLLGGLNDQCFKLIRILEAGREGRWPWEVA